MAGLELENCSQQQNVEQRISPSMYCFNLEREEEKKNIDSCKTIAPEFMINDEKTLKKIEPRLPELASITEKLTDQIEHSALRYRPINNDTMCVEWIRTLAFELPSIANEDSWKNLLLSASGLTENSFNFVKTTNLLEYLKRQKNYSINLNNVTAPNQDTWYSSMTEISKVLEGK